MYQYSHEFMYDWQAYAAAGYVVVAANPRGSSGRGFDFARAIYADWGLKDAEDVLAAADHAVAIGVADPDRLGIGGWSYGGILTNTVIARDRRFKAAVSGAGSANMWAIWGHDQYSPMYELESRLPLGGAGGLPADQLRLPNADKISTPRCSSAPEKDFNVPCIGAEHIVPALRSRGVRPGWSSIRRAPLHRGPELFPRPDRAELAWYDKYLK